MNIGGLPGKKFLPFLLNGIYTLVRDSIYVHDFGERNTMRIVNIKRLGGREGIITLLSIKFYPDCFDRENHGSD
ncbi:hypothetical protein JCM16138_17860 [Thermococcus atlanticus]